MANRPNTVPHPLNNIQTPSIPEQVLQILLEVVPHMPTESQVSFFSMFRDNASSLPFHEAPKAPYPLAHPSLLPDSLHNYVQAKTYGCFSRCFNRFNLSLAFSIYSNPIWHLRRSNKFLQRHREGQTGARALPNDTINLRRTKHGRSESQ